MGIYDVPAEIDYILNSTGHNKLYYIGHSMGTTMFFAGMSQLPQYNHKIHAMIAFAPAAFFTSRKNPVFHFVETAMEQLLEVNCCRLAVVLLSHGNSELHIARAFHDLWMCCYAADTNLMSVAAREIISYTLHRNFVYSGYVAILQMQT